MAKKENYYEILLKLSHARNQLKQLEKCNRFEFWDAFHGRLLETKALIFEYDILREEYIKRAKEFEEYSKTKKFEKTVQETFSRVKEFVTHTLHKKGVVMGYGPFYKWCKNEVLLITSGYQAKSLNYHRIYCDIPNLFLYSSIKAFVWREHLDGEKSDEIHIENSINAFYNCVNITGFDISDLIVLPENLAFYVSAVRTQIDDAKFTDRNVICFILSAMMEVLLRLEDFIYNEHLQLGFDLPVLRLPNSKKTHVIQWFGKNRHIEVDGAKLQELKGQPLCTFIDIVSSCKDQNLIPNLKNDVYKINKVFRKKFGKKVIKKYEYDNLYHVIEDDYKLQNQYDI